MANAFDSGQNFRGSMWSITIRQIAEKSLAGFFVRDCNNFRIKLLNLLRKQSNISAGCKSYDSKPVRKLCDNIQGAFSYGARRSKNNYFFHCIKNLTIDAQRHKEEMVVCFARLFFI